MPKISICIPTHNMKNKDFFLERALKSIRSQSFQDFEIIITDKGSMPVNTNSALKEATGEFVKILYMDDFLAHENALRDIVNNFESGDFWLITATDTNPNPTWTDDIETGNNKLGSPSALTMRRKSMLYFDERMSWLLDCDLYKRMEAKYGKPKILHKIGVCIGIHDGQMTNILTDEEKLVEHKIMNEKYA